MVRFSARVQERCKVENSPFSYYHVKWTAPIIKLLLETWLGLKKEEEEEEEQEEQEEEEEEKEKRGISKRFLQLLC